MRNGLVGNMPAKRINITIAEDGKLWLDGYAKFNKISVAEAVRQGIGLLKEGQRQNAYQKMVEITCGFWKKRNGMAYQG